ncbi:type I restriction endonuclease subunit R [Mariprofundus sp. EBB-1]|uniref:type I restriction endonuclease subunit R n=1 Tax=Mariprofundus sp. EBB-1 TaxID=2650971 RepID=UPI000EF1E7FB|nr:type I restriction endonuclease subunit R [Mariprofundus sp. EBB-1]RLL50705.1 type I restriction endonuclease subunit R [Mariprofundus sp. EBB-1]
MIDLNEDAIEQNLIDLLQHQGYTYFNDSTIAPNSDNPQRDAFDSVVLEKQFNTSLRKLNPDLPEPALHEAFQHVLHLGSNDIMTNNEKFHQMLCDGVTVEHFQDGQSVGLQVKLIDFVDLQNNDFWAVNQFVIKENNQSKRLDVILFVNGLPLVVIELKSATSEKATLERAYTQIQNYKTAIPSIFFYNALSVISDGLDARTSTLSAPYSRYLAWKSPTKEENGILPELQIVAEQMFKPDVLLKLIRFNTVFESEEIKDDKTGILSLVKIKKVAAYHQYYVVEKAVQSTLRAIKTVESEAHEDPAHYGLASVQDQPEGDRKIGVVWHTQGSGKSLSMVFYAGRLVVEPAMKNPTLVILTDRNDLDDQLFSTFGNCTSLLRQTPVQANNREHLKELLTVTGGGIVFTTIQKFYPEDGSETFDALSDRTNVVVVADEAHRSQYGFTGKVDKEGNIKYGNAKHLRDALPHASFIGFTGTPIEKEDRDTQQVFGNYIDVYDIAQAVKDGATVPLSYESRLVKIRFNDEATKKIDALVDSVEGATDIQLEKSKKKNAQINAIVGHPDRLADIAKDIVSHFEARQEVFEGKGMIVCMTRQIAVDLYEQIVALKPEWHDIDLNKGAIKVVMTSSSDDPASFQPHHTNKKDRKALAIRLKDAHDPLQLVIVQSMWLTGFDAPPLHTLYVDKKMQGAGLMQAIARVNRVYKDKPHGLIVDYIGIGQDLRSAMQVYVDSGGQGEVAPDIKEVIAGMLAKFEVVQQMFHGFEYQTYFKAETGEKLKVLLAAQNFILNDDKLKDRFLSEVTALSKLYVMAVPSYESETIKDDMAFFQAIKSRINKFTPTGGKTDAQVDSAIKQIVDDALSSDGVVDIFEAAGIKAPSLDILSEEFLLEVKNMVHKNLAFELLRKLLNDEVKVRKQKNMTQGKKFSEMLSSVIKRYHNNQIDTAQVIKELSDIARDMKLEDSKAHDLGLTPEEYAFYSILAQNDSTSFLEDHKMKELIHLIVDIIRKNATVDWNKRDDVKAKLRLLVKKVLMRYGYPPDLAKMEADRVLEQSDLLASEFSAS